MELDSIGNIYGVGSYEWNLNPNWYLNSSLIKLSPTGALRFAKPIKTKSYSYAKYSYLNIISNNNISFTTHSSDTTLFDNINLYTSPLCVWNTHPQFEFFSLRLDSLGNMTNIIPYELGTNMVNGVDFNMNALGESYFTIPYSGTVSVNGNTYTSNGFTDVLLYAFDVNANINWAQSFGSTGIDYCNSITFDNANNPVLHGTFESSITVSQTGMKSTTPISINSNGGKDVFYAKVNRSENIVTMVGNNSVTESDIILFPNPAKEKLYIKTANGRNDYKFELYDSFGKLVFDSWVSAKSPEINVLGYIPGIYFYKISDANKTVTGKVVVID